MASLLLGAVGAGVGSMFGYASIGWSIGSALGGMLGKEGLDVEGPRLNDKNISTSAYGNTRPLIFGSYRVGGDVIWSTDLIEHADKEEQGKGGGGGSYTTYNYTVSFALALCEGPITGVRKIWFNSELVYSVADDASVAELKASNEKSKGFRVYTGTTTQTADPTYQASVGAANAPAYRGTAYIVWTDLDVTKYGGLPSITVEVVQNGTDTITSKDTLPAAPASSLRQSMHFGDGVSYVFNGGGTSATYERFDIKTYSLSSNALLGTNYYYYDATGSDASGVFRFLYTESVSPSGNLGVIETGDLGTGNNSLWRILPIGDLDYQELMPQVLLMDNDLDNFRNGSDVSFNIRWQQIDGIDAYLWFYKSNSGQVYRYSLPMPVGVMLTLEGDDVFEVDISRNNLDPNGDQFTWSLDTYASEFYVKVKDYVTNATAIKRYDFDGTLIETKFSGTDELAPFAVSNGRLWTKDNATIQVYDWNSETLLYSQVVTNGANIGTTACTFEVVGNILAILENGIVYRFVLSLSNNGYALDQVVEEICNKVEILDADIDTTDLASDTVRGFLIARQSSARSALEQLSAAFFFDGRESDGVLEFIKRGGSSIATLTDDDVGCYEGDSVIELHEVERTQEEELPKSLTLRYANVNADYQTGAQHAIRQSVLNGTDVVVDLSIAMNDDEGKDIVDTTMFSIWENRTKYKHSTWLKHTKIDPADIITVDGKVLRVVSRAEGVNGIIELESVSELPEIYTGQIGTGVAGGHSNQSVYVGGPTLSYLLDIPPLRDEDYDDYGVYWAMDGHLDDWAGAALLRSPDGSTFDVKATATTGAAVGQATTVLGDWTGGNIFDETNVLRVTVSGTLESKTELEVLNGANLAIVGDELIQFKNADLVSTGVYDLSGLLRGRVGTDWAIDAHVVNERFALLNSTSTRFVQTPSTDLNTSRLWASLTLGKTIDAAQRTTLTYTGQNQRPITPVHLVGGTTGFNTAWTLKWIRSTRYRWQWLNMVTGGQDETSYDFEVRIYDDPDTPTTVLRTISATGATVGSDGYFSTSYSNANQVTDFGGHQARLAFSVRQLGDVANSEWSEIFTFNSGYTSNSVLLMHMDGTNGSTTFTDEYGHTPSVTGNAQISTAQSKFGGASGLFDGTLDRVDMAASADFDLNGVDFTVEFQINPSSLKVAKIIGTRVASASGWEIYLNSTGTVFWQGPVDFLETVATLSTGVFTHVACVMIGSTLKIYFDGVEKASGSAAYTSAATDTLEIGGQVSQSGRSINGYLDEIRITKGEGIYTGAFTPPSSAFTS